MKRFVFRLERLLQIRQTAEEECARALGLALQDEETCRLTALEGQARFEDAQGQVLASRSGPSPAGSIRNLELTVEQLGNEVATLEEAHRKSVERVDRAREQFEEARMAKRVIERLREERYEAWTQELVRYEQALSDETAGFLARERNARSE